MFSYFCMCLSIKAFQGVAFYWFNLAKKINQGTIIFFFITFSKSFSGNVCFYFLLFEKATPWHKTERKATSGLQHHEVCPEKKPQLLNFSSLQRKALRTWVCNLKIKPQTCPSIANKCIPFVSWYAIRCIWNKR